MRICNIIICGNKRDYIKSRISFMAGWNFEMLGFNKKPLEKGRVNTEVHGSSVHGSRLKRDED